MHTLQCLRSEHIDGLASETSILLIGQDERTDCSVRTYERALVALYTVVGVPCRNESLYTALLISSSSYLPCAIYSTMLYEVRHLEKVTALSIDRTHKLLYESGCVILLHNIVGKICPLRIHSELLVLIATVYSLVVLVHDILTLLAIRLHDKLLHLLYSEIYGDNASDTEEC